MWTDEELHAMNYAFCNAVAHALNAGLEHTPIGVVTAPCTERPTHIYILRHSTGGSPAGCCADHGERQKYDPRVNYA